MLPQLTSHIFILSYNDYVTVLQKYQSDLTSPIIQDNAHVGVIKNVTNFEKSHSKKYKDSVHEQKSSKSSGKVAKSSATGKTRSGTKGSKVKMKKLEEEAFNNRLAQGTAYFSSLKSYVDVCLRVNLVRKFIINIVS